MNIVSTALAFCMALLSGDASTAGMLDTLIGMVPKAFNLVGSIMSAIVGIDLFALLLAFSLIGVGISIFGKMRNSVT